MQERRLSPAQTEQVQLEERANRVLMSVLADEEFMAGVRRAAEESERGGKGTPWSQVKKELGIE